MNEQIRPGEAWSKLVAQAQNSSYDEGFDYVHGSPHLAHHGLHLELLGRLARLVHGAVTRTGSCRVLELGAGDGTFTVQLERMGADVMVTEMSSASVDVLRRRFADSLHVTVVLDGDGGRVFEIADSFDLVLCISMLHHVPDYARFLRRLTKLVRGGGSLATFQDPDWYPHRRRLDHAADRGAYYAWRLTQGDLLNGARTRVRRLGGDLDESLPADMTEYHVVRQGLDASALTEALRADFADVHLFRYWSTQAAPLQRLGKRLGLQNTFGIEADGRRDYRAGRYE